MWRHVPLTLNPLTWKIWWARNNASRWQIWFNSAFKGLIQGSLLYDDQTLGNYITFQSLAVTVHTTRLTTPTLRDAHIAFMCFAWISEQTATFASHTINRLVFITHVENIHCAVGTESYIKQIRFVCRELIILCQLISRSSVLNVRGHPMEYELIARGIPNCKYAMFCGLLHLFN